LTVVDLSRLLPGPLITRILGDLGARVIKVEHPEGGDPVRDAPPVALGRGSLAAILLSGHQSIALDLHKDGAREALKRLLEDADVLVESFRPGTLARWDLDPAELRQLFPRLVICSLSGWGQDGPHARRSGHDLGYQAVAGSLAPSGTVPAVPVADVLSAWNAATAVLAAIVRRGLPRTTAGEGAWIDQSLLDAAGHANLTAWAAEADGAKAVGEALPLTGALPCYDLYRTRDDGLLAIAALEPRFWRRFCLALGRKDLIVRQLDRGSETRGQIAAIVAERSRAEWATFLAEHDVPGEPVLSASEALAHPQVRHRELLRPGPDGLPRLGFPALFDGVRPRGGEDYPDCGQHTDELAEEFGLGAGMSSRQRRAAGIGRRFSLKRWALGVAGRLGSKLTSKKLPR
jgi:crotonobetainyl-CoA:carnitine CoA-transferase CaiB-like acyl-CoA transferase